MTSWAFSGSLCGEDARQELDLLGSCVLKGHVHPRTVRPSSNVNIAYNEIVKCECHLFQHFGQHDP